MKSIYTLIAEIEGLNSGSTPAGELLTRCRLVSAMMDDGRGVTWFEQQLDQLENEKAVPEPERAMIGRWIAELKTRDLRNEAREDAASGYDVAQICSNGHITNSSVISSPQENRRFCSLCGCATQTTCAACQLPIRGEYVAPNFAGGDCPLPLYCEHCGSSFPWTEGRMNAAKEFVDSIEALTEEERNVLKNDLTDLARETPRTALASNRFRSLMTKAGRETAGALRDIFVDLVSETVRKSLWP